MKLVQLSRYFLVASLSLPGLAFSEDEATVCYEESLQAVQILLRGHETAPGKLVYFTQIGETKVEGYEFSSGDESYVVIASTDSTVPGQLCRVSVIQP